MIDKIILALFIVGGTIMFLALISMPLLAVGIENHWISVPMFFLGFAVLLSIGPLCLWDLWRNPKESSADG